MRSREILSYGTVCLSRLFARQFAGRQKRSRVNSQHMRKFETSDARGRMVRANARLRPDCAGISRGGGEDCQVDGGAGRGGAHSRVIPPG